MRNPDGQGVNWQQGNQMLATARLMWITMLREIEKMRRIPAFPNSKPAFTGNGLFKNEHGTHAEGKSDDGGAATDREWVSNATNPVVNPR